MRRARLFGIPLALVAALTSACSSEKKTAPAATGDASADEARAVAAARPFLEALVAQDHAKAYGFASSHLRARLTQEAFAQKNREAHASLGTPIRLDNVGAEVDPVILAGGQTGDDELDKAANRLLAATAIGDIPDSVPVSVRRASVSGNVVFGKSEDGEEGTDPFYVVTAVLVDDGGQLRVGHYFFRAASMLDD